MTARTPTESGSAFFLILIGIFLFAGLSYAIMQSSRTSVATLTQEQARVAAQEIVSYSNTIQAAIQRLRLAGCAENQISVSHPTEFSWGTYVNASAPADGSCSVYNMNGGRALAQKAPEIWFAGGGPNEYWAYNAREAIQDVGSATSTEFLFVLAGIKKEICISINNVLGIGSPNVDPPTASYYDNLGFTGSFAAVSHTLTHSDLDGKSAFCLKDTDNKYKYVRVVIAR